MTKSLRKHIHCLLLAMSPMVLTAQQTPMMGANLASAEFTQSNGQVLLTYYQHYVYPGETELDYFHSKGVRLVRLPFRWERIQNTLYGNLEAAELNRIDTFLDQAEARDMQVILDMHNYAGRVVYGMDSNPSKPGEQGFKIVSPEVPISAYQDVWKKMAAHFKNRDNIWAYGLMNEPTGISTTNWLAAVQAAVDGVREEDMEHYVLLPGTYYSNAHRWPNHGEYLINVVDPADKRIFEAHSYWDGGHDGSYNQSFASSGLSVNYGVNDITAFVNWCNANNVQGFIGEFGVPWQHSDWTPVLENALEYMQANGVSGTIWAGGPWWNPNYELNIEIDSRNNAPRYPMDVLQNFTNGHIQPYAPDFRIYGDGIASGLLYSYSYSFGGAGAAVDVDPESTDQAQSGRKSFKVTYSLPPDSNANCGMHIEGGFYLTDNIATAGHVLSLNIRGDPGANFELHLQDVTGASGLKVTITDYGPAIGNSWQKYEIPLTDLVNASMDGSDYIERIQMDLLNQDTTQRSFHIDNMKVEGPEYVPETPEPPIAQPDSVERYAGETLTFNTATLLLNDTSPEGRPLFVPGVSSLSSQGASVVLDGDWISYIPPTGMNDTDTFTYSIEDSWRVQATGTVTVRVPEAEGPSSPDHVNLRPDIESGSIRLRFGGIVGATYRIQTSVDLEVWTLLSTLESFGNGMINFTHPGGFLTSKRFYRLIRD